MIEYYKKRHSLKNIKRNSISKSDSELLLNKTISLLVNNLKNKNIKISGLGSFNKFISPSRPGRNPKTGDEYQIPKKERIRFNVSKLIKDQIN